MRTLTAILGLLVVTVGQPVRALITVGAIRTPGSASDVAVANGIAYVADDDAGLRVIDFGPEYLPEPSQMLLCACALATLGALRRRAA